MPSVIPDTPITSPDEDELGRRTFAASIADFILSAPPKSSLRIGVYGGWGEGKTSVLRLVERRLRLAGHCAVWLAPWATSTREELLDDLLFKVAAELSLDVKELRKARRGAEVAQQLRDTARSDMRLRFAEILLGPSLAGHFKRAIDVETEAFFNEIEKQLKSRKLVVFVDDVDRIRPDVVPQVLLTLREVLDHPNFYYVLALAPDIVEKGLGKVHEAWGGRKQFLEKIIELPLHLPHPTEEQWKDFIQQQATKFPPSPLWSDELADFVPRNPRKAKLFFRFASSLDRLLSRFSDDEIDWRTLALCLLLILEFPEETRALVNDAKAISDLEYGGFSEHGDETGKKGKEKVYQRFAPKDAPERYLELCEAIRSREMLTGGAYSLRDLLTIHESPPLVTWREFNELRAQITAKGFKTLSAWLSSEVDTREERARAFFRLVLKWRGNLLDAAAEADTQEELMARLTESADALALLRKFMEERLPCGAQEWLGVYAQAAHWTHFDRPSYYAEARSAERELLSESIELIPLAAQIDVLAAQLTYDPPVRKRAAQFTDLTASLNARLQRVAVDVAIEAFETPDGLDKFWGAKGRSPLKWMLFDPESAFHASTQARDGLRVLFERAINGNQIVQRNFRTYFRMLTYAAYEEGGSFPRADSRKILQSADFVTLIWRAAVAKPLNPRTMGSLREDRTNVIKDGVPERALPLPDWWVALEGELSTPDSQLEQRDEGDAGDDDG